MFFIFKFRVIKLLICKGVCEVEFEMKSWLKIVVYIIGIIVLVMVVS